MSNAMYLFEKGVQALKNYVSENTPFSVNVDVSRYPVKISFFEDERQLTIESNGDGDSEKVPSLQFVFYDKMQIVTQDDFHIAEETFNKLKSLSKEVNRLLLNAFFAKFNTFEKTVTEQISNTEGLIKIGNPSTGWDGKEFFLCIAKPNKIIESIISSVTVEVEE